MYERMLNKQEMPALSEMAAYCGENGALFTELNGWLSSVHNTSQKITFPYGNNYGWCVSHRKNKRLICNIFAEKNAFAVMLRLSARQYASVYDTLLPYTQDYIDHKYPCGDGGWIHYRVTCGEHMGDAQSLLTVKCT